MLDMANKKIFVPYELVDQYKYRIAWSLNPLSWDDYYEDKLTWDSCREQIQSGRRKNGFYLQYRIGSINNVIRLVRFVENKLNVKKKYQSKFYKTDKKYIYYVEFGFWRTNGVRFSFFTAILKSAKSHRNYLKMLKESVYFKINLIALKRFLSGKTELNKKQCMGWKTEFTPVKGGRYDSWSGWDFRYRARYRKPITAQQKASKLVSNKNRSYFNKNTNRLTKRESKFILKGLKK